MSWFKHEHQHVWKMTSTVWSATPGYEDKTEVEFCKCGEWRTVQTHKCSACGHTDEKKSLTLRGQRR